MSDDDPTIPLTPEAALAALPKDGDGNVPLHPDDFLALARVVHAAQVLEAHHDYIVRIRDGRDAPYCTKANVLRDALGELRRLPPRGGPKRH